MVGDQLKLASDTIRRVSEGTMSTNTPTVYDPPDAQRGSSSTASDIWALGVSLFEVLTRRPPSGLGESGSRRAAGGLLPEFRDVVARCLSPSPQDRPSVSELITWARGRSAGSAPAATIQPVTLVPPEPRTPEPAPPRTAPPQVAPEAARLAPSMGQSQRPRALLTVMLGAFVILALCWTGLRVLRGPSHPAIHLLSGSRRITVTDSGRRRTSGSGGAGARLCGVDNKPGSERGGHVAISAP